MELPGILGKKAVIQNMVGQLTGEIVGWAGDENCPKLVILDKDGIMHTAPLDKCQILLDS